MALSVREICTWKLRFGLHAKGEIKWMEVAWQREQAEEHWSITRFVEKELDELEIKIEFGSTSVKINGENIEGDAKKNYDQS